MNNDVINGWEKSKEELALNLDELITNNSEFSDTLKIMLNMLENSKIKK